MNDPIAVFPNETYLNGLRDADASVVDALYNEFRQPVARAVEALGGTYADGATFFRVAIIQTAQLLQEGQYPSDTPIFLYLKNLATAQYKDWLQEKGQEVPSAAEPREAESQIMETLPNSESLRETRLQVRAKRQFTRLSNEDQKQILTLAKDISEGAEVGTESYKPVLDRYKSLLGERDSNWESGLPVWATSALTNTHFHQIWSACEAMERRLSASQVPTSGENKTIRYAFITFVVLTLGYAAFTWFFRDRTPAEVYDNNFQPPASILEDMAARYAKDSVAPERPEACTIAFSQADMHYKKREWREAAAELASMMNDTLKPCQSDALFYLAIVGLQLERPELTVECIAKIEDLERFGEDIYWYMALAYVKMAAQDPSEKNIARRAVQRALSNTEIPERRAKAEKMLEELGE